MKPKLILIALIALAATAASAAPAQFVAKLYTEALGRAPDADGWDHYLNDHGATITLEQAREIAREFYASPKYKELRYDAPEQVITLYRGLLSRDPDPSGMESTLRLVRESGILAAVDAITSSQEFREVVFVQMNDLAHNLRYGWRTTSFDFLGTEQGSAAVATSILTASELQDRIDAAADNGGVVELPQRCIVRGDRQIVLRPGVTLRTKGDLNKNQYARFARILRTERFRKPLLALEEGAAIEHIWTDGASSVVGRMLRPGYNLELAGANSSVRECRVSNTCSGTILYLAPSAENASVRDSLLTSYSSWHVGGKDDGGGPTWNDGITCNSPSAMISGNGVIDATDLHIIVFSGAAKGQSTQVTHNTLVSAGNSAFAMLGVDPNTGIRMNNRTIDFAGTRLENNLLLGSNGGAHADILLTVGTRAWFGAVSNTLKGPCIIRNNRTSNVGARCNVGILASDAIDATVTDNDLKARVDKNVNDLPAAKVVILTDTIAGDSTIQSSETDAYKTADENEINNRIAH